MRVGVQRLAVILPVEEQGEGSHEDVQVGLDVANKDEQLVLGAFGDAASATLGTELPFLPRAAHNNIVSSTLKNLSVKSSKLEKKRGAKSDDEGHEIPAKVACIETDPSGQNIVRD